jgi:hypothetical protein
MCSHDRVVVFSMGDLSRSLDIYQAGIFLVTYLSDKSYYMISTVLQFYYYVLQVYELSYRSV